VKFAVIIHLIDYLNITGIRQGPGKMLLGPGKVLEIFLTKTVGTLCHLQLYLTTAIHITFQISFSRYYLVTFVLL